MEEEKKVEHKGVKVFIVIFIVVSLFFLIEENQQKVMSLFKGLQKGDKQLELVNSIDITGVEDIKAYDNSVVMWQPNKVSFLDMPKDIMVEKDFNFVDPEIYYGKNNIYILNKSIGDIYIMDSNGNTVDRKQLDKEILNIEEIGNTVIYHTKEESIENVDIYGKDDLLLGDYEFNESSVINYSVSDNEEKFLIAALDLSGDSLKSKIYFYGKNNEQLNVLDIKGELVIYSRFVGDDSVILTDKSLYYIKKHKIMWQKSFNLIKDIYVDSDINILYSSYLETIDFEGRTVQKVSFGEKYEKIVTFNKDLLLYGDKYLTLISGEKQILSHEEDMIKASSNKNNVIILKQDKLDIYNVVNKK